MNGVIKTSFEQEIAKVINRFSKENESNTPDFILADYLASCMLAYNKAISERDRWYGITPRPGVR